MKSLSQVTVASAYHWVAQADLARLRTPPTATAPAAVRGMRPRDAVVLGTCCLSLFLTGLDNTAVNVGLPMIGAQLHAPVAGLQWVVAAYTVVLASLLDAGRRAGRPVRSQGRVPGLRLFTLGSWLCSLAPGLAWLIAFRALQGAGASMLNPAALGIITSTFTRPAERAKAVGAWDAVFGLSMALGPVAGGALAEAAGWRAIFWANIPVGLAAICLTGVLVPDSRAGSHAERTRPDRPWSSSPSLRSPWRSSRDPPWAGRRRSSWPRHRRPRSRWPCWWRASCAGPSRWSTSGCSPTRGSRR